MNDESLTGGLSAMEAEPQSTEFRQHERVLWRVLLSLSKSGFFVPPDDARDLIHDFYVEAWEGLRSRHDPSIANFNTYVAGAFHRFARRRAVQMDQSRRKLVDLDDVGELASPQLGPAATLERKQDINSLQFALSRLSGLERSLLLEHFGDERQSERLLATRHSLTRYTVRSTLATALEKISSLILRSQTSQVKPGVARRFSTEVSPLFEYAHASSLTSRLGERQLKRFYDWPTNAIHQANDLHFEKGPPMDGRDEQAIRDALLEGSEAAFRFLAGNADRLRDSLTRSDDFDLEAYAIDQLREHPERLSRLYEILLSDEDPQEVTEVEWAVERARVESAVEVGEAFELMAEGLPSELLQWERWFPVVPDDGQYREYLASQPSVRAGGRAALEFTRFAMTPDTVAGAMRGLQLLFDEKLDIQQPSYGARDTEEPSLLLVRADMKSHVGVGQVEAQIATGPFVPRVSEMPRALTNWVFSLIQERPFCVPNYLFEMESNGRPSVTALPAWEQSARADLRALWTRPAPRAARELAYN